MKQEIAGEWLSLVDACAELHLSYHRGLRLLLIGVLDGRKEENGRRSVSRASVERYRAGQRGSPAETAVLLPSAG